MSVASQASSAAHLKAHAAAQAAAGYVPQSVQSVGNVKVNLHATPPITTSMRTAKPTINASPPPKSASLIPSTSSPPANDVSIKSDELLWKLDMNGVKTWMQRILLPKRPKQRLDAHKQPLQAGSIRGDAEAYRLEQERLQNEEWKSYTERSNIAKILFNNLIRALDSATGTTSVEQQPGNDTKRMKVESGAAVPTSYSKSSSGDEYSILDPSFAKGKEITHLPGAIVSRILMGGLVNALAGKIGGVVDAISCKPLLPEGKDAPIPTANGQTLTQLREMFVTRLHGAISARLEIDKLNSIPTRIVEMLCPEITMTEIAGIRQRIYDTVVLGRGTHSSSAAAALEGEEDLAVAARVDVHEFKKCGGCGNNDQNKFVMDQKNGDLICKDCGTIVEESLMHEGSQFRKFEGEADRNHHGDVANPLYSNSYNMGTSLGGMSFQSGAGLGGYGSGGRGGIENVLRNAHAYIEMNMSQFGKEEKKTRIGYKDRQKREAVIEMKHVVDALSLHNAVIERAKELFAGFRDDRELVQQFKGVLAACLCQAFDQLSKDGRQILKQKAGEEECDTNEVKEDLSQNVKRESLHGAALARKSMVGSSMSATEMKSASLWDLDDTRSWLLETSRTIARKWEQKKSECEESRYLR